MTQQKQHLQRMCLETKQVIGREKGTEEEIKGHGTTAVEENGGEGGRQGGCVEWQSEGARAAAI